jgi:hypothetical protein
LRKTALLENPIVKQNVDAPAARERAGVSLISSAFGAGIFYGGLALVISPLFALAWFATRVAPISESAVWVLISSPLWFALLGALFGALNAYVYNVLLRTMAMPLSPEAKAPKEKDHITAVGF